MSVPMVRDVRDEWPNDVPVGTFDIVEHGPDAPGVTGHIMFVCPGKRRCGVFVGPAFIPREEPDALNVWGWDGDLDKPTLKPSINCVGGCGWHGFITSGVITVGRCLSLKRMDR